MTSSAPAAPAGGAPPLGVTVTANINPVKQAFNDVRLAAKAISDAFMKMGRDGDDAGKKIQDRMTSIHYTVRNTSSAIRGFYYTLFQAISAPIALYSQFERSLLMYAAVTRNLGEQVNLTSGRMVRAKELFLELGKTSVFSAQQVADAAIELARLGFSAQEVEKSMGGVINAATAAGIGIEQAAALVAGAIRGFRLSADEAVHVADLLAVAANKSAAGFGDLAYAFKYVGPAAAAAGQSIEDITGLLALLANNMIRGTQAGNSLQNMITRLQKPPKEAAKALDKLNLAVNDDGKMRNFVDILRDLREKFSGVDQATQAATIKVIAGEEALSAMSAIVNTTNAEFEDYIKTMQNVDGESEKAANVMKQGLFFALEQLKETVVTLGIDFGEHFAVHVRWAADALRQFAEWIMNLPGWMKSFIAGSLMAVTAITAISGALLVVVGTFTGLLTSLGVLKDIFKVVASNRLLFPTLTTAVTNLGRALTFLAAKDVLVFFGNMAAWLIRVTGLTNLFTSSLLAAQLNFGSFVVGGVTVAGTLGVITTAVITLALALPLLVTAWRIWNDLVDEQIANDNLSNAQMAHKSTMLRKYSEALEAVNKKIDEQNRKGEKADNKDLEKKAFLMEQIAKLSDSKETGKDLANQARYIEDRTNKIKEAQLVLNKAKERTVKIEAQMATLLALRDKMTKEGNNQAVQGINNMIKRLEKEKASNKNTERSKELLIAINEEELRRNDLLIQRKRLEEEGVDTQAEAEKLAQIDAEINKSINKQEKELEPELQQVLGIDPTEEDDKARKERLEKQLGELEALRRKHETDLYNFKNDKEREFQGNVKKGLESQREFLMSINDLVPGGAIGGRGMHFGADRPGTRTHAGQDIGAATGTDVKAAFSGKVLSAGLNGGYGNMILVQHANGIKTLYAHLSKMLVKEGQQIMKGQRIGAVGGTGAGGNPNAYAPHLHFEISKNGVNMDPMKFMGQSVAEYNPEQRKAMAIANKELELAKAEEGFIRGKMRGEGNAENLERWQDELDKAIDKQRSANDALRDLDTSAMQERMRKADEERQRILQIIEEVKNRRINVELETQNVLTKVREGEMQAELDKVEQEIKAYKEKAGSQEEIERLKVAMIEKLHSDLYARIEQEFRNSLENMQGFLLSGFSRNVLKVIQDAEKEMRDINSANRARNKTVAETTAHAHDMGAVHPDHAMNKIGGMSTLMSNPLADLEKQLSGGSLGTTLSGMLDPSQNVLGSDLTSAMFSQVDSILNSSAGNAFHPAMADFKKKTEHLFSGEESPFIRGIESLISEMDTNFGDTLDKGQTQHYEKLKHQIREQLYPEMEKYYAAQLKNQDDVDQQTRDAAKAQLDLSAQMIQKAEQYGLLSKHEIEYRQTLIQLQKEDLLRQEKGRLQGDGGSPGRIQQMRAAIEQARKDQEEVQAQAARFDAARASNSKQMTEEETKLKGLQLGMQDKVKKLYDDFFAAVKAGDREQAQALLFKINAYQDINNSQAELTRLMGQVQQIDLELVRNAADRESFVKAIAGYQSEIVAIQQEENRGAITHNESLDLQLSHLDKVREAIRLQLKSEQALFDNAQEGEAARRRAAELETSMGDVNRQQLLTLNEKMVREGDIVGLLTMQGAQYDGNYEKLLQLLKLVRESRNAWEETIEQVGQFDTGVAQILQIVKFLEKGFQNLSASSANFQDNLSKITAGNKEGESASFDQIFQALSGTAGSAAGAGIAGAVATAFLAVNDAVNQANEAARQHNNDMAELRDRYREVQIEIKKTTTDLEYLNGQLTPEQYSAKMSGLETSAIDSAISAAEEKKKRLETEFNKTGIGIGQAILAPLAGIVGTIFGGFEAGGNLADMVAGGMLKRKEKLNNEIMAEGQNIDRLKKDKEKADLERAKKNQEPINDIINRNRISAANYTIDPMDDMLAEQKQKRDDLVKNQREAMEEFKGSDAQRSELMMAQNRELLHLDQQHAIDRLALWRKYHADLRKTEQANEADRLNMMADSQGKRMAQIDLETKRKQQDIQDELDQMTALYGEEVKLTREYQAKEAQLGISKDVAERQRQDAMRQYRNEQRQLELESMGDGVQKSLAVIEQERSEQTAANEQALTDYENYLKSKYRGKLDAAGKEAKITDFMTGQELETYQNMLDRKGLLDEIALEKKRQVYRAATREIAEMERQIRTNEANLTSDTLDNAITDLNGTLAELQEAREDVYEKYSGSTPEDIQARDKADKVALTGSQNAYRNYYSTLRDYALEYNDYRRETETLAAENTKGLEDDLSVIRANNLERLMQQEQYELVEFGDSEQKKLQITQRYAQLRLKANKEAEQQLANITMERFERVRTLRTEQLRQDSREYELEYRKYQDQLRGLERQRRDLERQKQQILDEIARLNRQFDDTDTTRFNSDLSGFQMSQEIRKGLQLISNPTGIDNSRVSRQTQKEGLEARTKMLEDEAEANRTMEKSTQAGKTALQDYVDKMKTVVLTRAKFAQESINTIESETETEIQAMRDKGMSEENIENTRQVKAQERVAYYQMLAEAYAKYQEITKMGIEAGYEGQLKVIDENIAKNEEHTAEVQYGADQVKNKLDDLQFAYEDHMFQIDEAVQSVTAAHRDWDLSITDVRNNFEGTVQSIFGWWDKMKTVLGQPITPNIQLPGGITAEDLNTRVPTADRMAPQKEIVRYAKTAGNAGYTVAGLQGWYDTSTNRAKVEESRTATGIPIGMSEGGVVPPGFPTDKQGFKVHARTDEIFAKPLDLAQNFVRLMQPYANRMHAAGNGGGGTTVIVQMSDNSFFGIQDIERSMKNVVRQAASVGGFKNGSMAAPGT